MNLRSPATLVLLGLASVLTLSVAAAAARTTWHALGYFPETGAVAALAPAPAAPEPPDLAPIHGLAPFGVAIAAETGPMQATASNLSLRGVILAYPARQSSALISSSGGEIRPFAIGETLPGGATLDSVAPDHVVLLVAGRRETLAFPQTQMTSGVAAIRAGIPGLAAASGAPAQPSAADVVDVYRQKIADNPQTVIDEFGVSATPQGYMVGDNLAASVRRAGLQPGDLVVRINGVAVGDIEQDRRHFEDVAASGRARVEVMRDDRLLILSFPLR